jgi:hypothetical protein
LAKRVIMNVFPGIIHSWRYLLFRCRHR